MADKEYIERGAIVEHLNNKVKTDYEMGLHNHGAFTEAFIRFIKKQPAADVIEVVRCKDCTYNERGSCVYSEDYPNYDPDFYCAHGERKEQT